MSLLVILSERQPGPSCNDNVKEGLELIFVDNVDDVLKIALTKPLIPIEWDESESVSGGSEISEDDQDQDQDPLLTH